MTAEESAPSFPFTAQCPFHQPAEFAWRRENAPVAPITLPTGNRGWLVTRFEDVRTVLTDERFSRRPVRDAAVERNQDSQPGFDFGASIADPEHHARWRALTARVFNVRQAETMRPRVAQVVESLLDETTSGQRPVDLMETIAFQLPLRVLFQLFEVPDDLRRGYLDWADALGRAGASMSEFSEAMNGLHSSVRELVARARSEPHGVVGELLATPFDDGQPCSDEMAVTTLMLMTVAGYETVATQFGNGMLALLQHSEQLDLIRHEKVDIEPAVEEILRYAQSNTGFAGITFPTEDIELATATIPSGEPVLISIDSAGRDSARTSDPETFDLTRGAARHHLVFGFGTHFCLGAPLARVELQEVFRRTVRRFPALHPQFDPAQPEMISNRFTRYPRRLPVSW